MGWTRLVGMAALVTAVMGAAVPSSLHPPALRLHSAAHTHAGAGRGSYLVADARGKQASTGDEAGVITIRLNVQPFVRAVQTQLSAIADAAVAAGGAAASAGGQAAEAGLDAAKAAAAATSKAVASAGDVVGEAGGKALRATGEAGGKALRATGKAATEALAVAQQAAFNLEDIVQEHPNEAAAVGITLVAIAALKAALTSAQEESVELPPSLMAKIKEAAASSSTSLGAKVTGLGTAAKASLKMPSATNISASLKHMGNVTASSLKGAST
jgi:hypothetical protein